MREGGVHYGRDSSNRSLKEKDPAIHPSTEMSSFPLRNSDEMVVVRGGGEQVGPLETQGTPLVC